MSRIFSNDSNHEDDMVCKPFNELLQASKKANLVSPYFTEADILLAANPDTEINLLVDINQSTCPNALQKILTSQKEHEGPTINVRFFTPLEKLHAKLFIFQESALLGSANLTKNGLCENREVVIEVCSKEDPDTFGKLQDLFKNFWNGNKENKLDQEKLNGFKDWHDRNKSTPDDDQAKKNKLEKLLGITDGTHNGPQSDRISVLDEEINELYKPAFEEIAGIIKENNFLHPDLEEFEIEFVVNRFLNYIYNEDSKMVKDWKKNTKKSKKVSDKELRYQKIMKYAEKWKSSLDNNEIEEIDKIEKYIEGRKKIFQTFGSREKILNADEEQILNGLNLLETFKNARKNEWSNNDLKNVQETFTHLLDDGENFIHQIHDVIPPEPKCLRAFASFRVFELYGTVYPHNFPPVTEQIADVLDFLGFRKHKKHNELNKYKSISKPKVA